MNEIATVSNSLCVFDPDNLLPRFISYIDRTPATARAYIINLRQFFLYLKMNRTTSPTRESVTAYRDWLSEEHKPNTVKAYLQAVKQFFSWTAAEGLYPNIAANIHAPKVKTDRHKKDALTPSEVLTIETSIDEHTSRRTQEAGEAAKDRTGRMQRSNEQGLRLKAMYLLAVNAGLRTVEISRANVKDLETRNGVTYLYIFGKGHTEADQRKPIAPEVKQAIDEYLQSRTDPATGNSPLFVSTGNRSRGKRIATTTISTMLKHAMQEAGFDSERLTAHSLRHTTGTTVQEITGNLYATQQYMRHANPATTEIYLHNETERQEVEIAQQLYDRYHSRETVSN